MGRADRCRADQYFQVFSRDVLHTAINMTQNLPAIWQRALWPYNWAHTWGKLGHRLYANGKLQVVDDIVHLKEPFFFAHQQLKPNNMSLLNHCSNMLAVHLGRPLHINASKIFREMDCLAARSDLPTKT